jgi:hypothetical protein
MIPSRRHIFTASETGVTITCRPNGCGFESYSAEPFKITVSNGGLLVDSVLALSNCPTLAVNRFCRASRSKHLMSKVGKRMDQPQGRPILRRTV